MGFPVNSTPVPRGGPASGPASLLAQDRLPLFPQGRPQGTRTGRRLRSWAECGPWGRWAPAVGAWWPPPPPRLPPFFVPGVSCWRGRPGWSTSAGRVPLVGWRKGLGLESCLGHLALCSPGQRVVSDSPQLITDVHQQGSSELQVMCGSSWAWTGGHGLLLVQGEALQGADAPPQGHLGLFPAPPSLPHWTGAGVSPWAPLPWIPGSVRLSLSPAVWHFLPAARVCIPKERRVNVTPLKGYHGNRGRR